MKLSNEFPAGALKMIDAQRRAKRAADHEHDPEGRKTSSVICSQARESRPWFWRRIFSIPRRIEDHHIFRHFFHCDVAYLLALCFIGSLALLVLLIVQRIVDLIRASAGAIDVQINMVVSWCSDRRERKPGPRKHYGLILAIAPQNRHDVRCVAVPRKDVLELVEVLSGILKGSDRHAFNLDREWLPRVLPSLTRIRPGQR